MPGVCRPLGRDGTPVMGSLREEEEEEAEQDIIGAGLAKMVCRHFGDKMP